ncbi:MULTISPECIES: MFS transporter [unclassified Methylobacterium]|jgi:MFS family permease|uniref:MFS transporter n=1 Tax=unclassified Methylobacterium TaxID=2615210 RepID=UPI001FEDA7B2|nr:MFS transporter [Methylobacterium sp. 2A]
MRPARASLRVLIVLAVAQIIGWGSVGVTAVVAPLIAADLGMDLAAVFAGNLILYATMGLSAPILGRAFVRYGARSVMIAGNVLAGPGFVGLALATGPVSYGTAWIVLGVASSATLTNAANILLNEIAGRGARRAIAALMLATGLSSSLFWPITAFRSRSSAGGRPVSSMPGRCGSPACPSTAGVCRRTRRPPPESRPLRRPRRRRRPARSG